ncbi:MAG TPA: class I SAM-dependent methyltransferase, partial [Candidatus Gemmiger stercorigallinarum]|nr:class I SAM-dependent methyltransferase [Candidatus Gemmiger stercorigallinarum]
MALDARLAAAAELCRPGLPVADVGCDHGYLGIYLVQQGIARTVAAMDLRREPLETARRNAQRFGTAEQMTFTVCDGLTCLEAGQVDTVACAGMGGDTIAGILEACPWFKDEEVTWILQ